MNAPLAPTVLREQQCPSHVSPGHIPPPNRTASACPVLLVTIAQMESPMSPVQLDTTVLRALAMCGSLVLPAHSVQPLVWPTSPSVLSVLEASTVTPPIRQL